MLDLHWTINVSENPQILKLFFLNAVDQFLKLSSWTSGHCVFFCSCLFAEEVSARIVQVVTAEAVAVLKGEQEKEAQHKDQSAALPLGK